MTEESASGGTVKRKPPGQTTERIGAFADAVLAIAMTLLVIDIPRPDSSDFSVGHGRTKEQAFLSLWHFLFNQRQALYAYVLAFGILWVVWRQHHALFDQYDRITTAMVQWHSRCCCSRPSCPTPPASSATTATTRWRPCSTARTSA